MVILLTNQIGLGRKGEYMAADTKQVIADALFEILKHKSFDTVTVKYLVKTCGISRQTFYYHFRDLMDVLEWDIRQILERDLENILRTEDFQSAIRFFVTQTVEKRAVIRLLLDSHRRPELERLLVQALRAYLSRLFRHEYPNSQLSASDVAIALDFLTCGVIGVLLGACAQPSPDPEQLTGQLCRLLSGEMHRQLL